MKFFLTALLASMILLPGRVDAVNQLLLVHVDCDSYATGAVDVLVAHHIISDDEDTKCTVYHNMYNHCEDTYN